MLIYIQNFKNNCKLSAHCVLMLFWMLDAEQEAQYKIQSLEKGCCRGGTGRGLVCSACRIDFKRFQKPNFWYLDSWWSLVPKTNKEKSSRWLLKCYSFLLIKLIIKQLAESFIPWASLPSCVILLNSTQLCTVTSGPTLKNRGSNTLSHFSKITWLVIFRAGNQ